MSEIQKNPFDALLDAIREVVRQEVRVALGDGVKVGDQSPSLLSVKEAAKIYSVPKSWIAEAARSGELPSVKVGHYRRFTREDLNAYIEKHRKEKALDKSP